MRRLVPAALAGAALTLALAGCKRPAAAEPEAPPLQLRCVAPSVERVERAVTLRGVVEIAPGRHAVVAPQVAGRLLSVAVREGDRVRRGAVVAQVESQPTRDAMTQAEAGLASATSAAENAQVTADRTRRLFEHGISARQEVDDAGARLQAAQAQVQAARAARDVAARNLSLATVRAPLDGVVLRTLRAPGDLVDGTPSTPVVEIGDPRAVELATSAVPADLVQLQDGQRGQARFDALPGRTFPVVVRTIAPAIDAATGVGTVRLTLATDGGAPPIGLAGEARIATGEDSGVLMIPATALRGTPAGGSEVLLCDQGHLRARAVRLGTRTADRVAVVEGLARGDKLVATDVLGLADGAEYQEAR